MSSESHESTTVCPAPTRYRTLARAWNRRRRWLTLGSGLVFASPLLSRPCLAECRIAGTLSKPLTIYTAKVGNESIARLTGNAIGAQLDQLPAQAPGRARLVTQGFRVDGFVELPGVPLRLDREIGIVPDHAWIARGAGVEFLGARADQVRVVPGGDSVIEPRPETWTSCDALSLGPESLRTGPLAGDARAYVLDLARTDLFASATAESALFRARRAAVEPLLFWSTEPALAARIHVQYRGRLRLDAWAKASELRALPAGETLDQLGLSAPSEQQGSSALAQSARSTVAVQRAALRVQARLDAPIIGFVQPGTAVYVLEVMRGWASVLPKSLALLPSGTGRFWVNAAELGL